MKKLFIMALLTLGFTFITNAQEVSFGVKGGANLANFVGDDLSADMKLGPHFGALAEIMFTDKFGVQPELIFSVQGAQQDFGDETLKENLNYINLPIMAKYYVTKGLSLEAGLQFGTLLSAKIKVDGETEDVEDIKGLDISFGTGVGYKLDSGLNFTLRSNFGLSNIYKDSDDDKIRNSVLQFSVGYMF